MAEHDVFERKLRAALARHVADGPIDFDALSFARLVVAGEPRRSGLAGWIQQGRFAIPRPVSILLVSLALLAALIGGALLVGSRPQLERPAIVPPAPPAIVPTVPLSPAPARQTPTPPQPGNVALVPTALEAVVAGCVEGGPSVVTDGLGVAWRGTAGQVTRFDPATGWARSWLVFGDADLAAGAEEESIAPARDGGVWLVGPHALRRFDGATIREVVEAPAELTTAMEAADGTLWAATADGAILHWDGTSWTRLDANRPNDGAIINAMAVDAAGHPWLGWIQTGTDGAVGWVSHHDGASWTIFDERTAPALGGDILGIVTLPDEEVLVLSSEGIVRFDGSTWTTTTAPLGDSYAWNYGATSLIKGPDGAAWQIDITADGSDGVIRVVRFLGGSRTDGPSDGLPRLPGWWLPSLPFVADGRMYLEAGSETDRGTYVLAGDRWERLEPTPPQPCELNELLAVSADELWAATHDGLWQSVAGTWTEPGAAPDGDLELAPDGSVWAAAVWGISVERDGRWIIADPFQADALAAAGDGTVWACGAVTQGCDLLALRFGGSGWTSDRVMATFPSGLPGRAGSLAIDRAGGVWAASAGDYVRGWLARFDGQRWTEFTEIAGRAFHGAEVKGMADDGAMWVVYWMRNGESFSARWDGTAWTDTDPGIPLRDGLTVAPDGSVWRGLDRYEDGTWTRPAAWASLPSMTVASMAPDGTAFVRLGSNYFRLPALGEP